MNEIVKECIDNIDAYLNAERDMFYGLFKGNYPGGFSHVIIKERAYFVHFLVDEYFERMFVDVYPQCICEKPYLNMMHAYVNKKTSSIKAGRIDIAMNGQVKIRIETSIVERAASIKDIKDMEGLAIQISQSVEKRLDRIAHGVLFREDDPDVMSDIEKEEFSLSKISEFDDDFDDDSDDEDSNDEVDDVSSSNEDNKSEENTDGESSKDERKPPNKSFEELFPEDDA